MLLELLFIDFEKKLEARESFFPFFTLMEKKKRDKKSRMYFRQL